MHPITLLIVLIMVASSFVQAFTPREPDIRVEKIKGRLVQSNCRKKKVRGEIVNEHLRSTWVYDICKGALKYLNVNSASLDPELYLISLKIHKELIFR